MLRQILVPAGLVVAVHVSQAAELARPETPRVTISDSKDLRVPLPYPYNERADATKDVEAAFARARANGKRVVIDFGGNWCPDCRILAGVLERREVKPFIDANFEMITVDVGRLDKNMHVPERFGAKVTGVPWLVIAEPDGTVIHSSYEITDNGFAQKPQAMVDWLAKWANKASLAPRPSIGWGPAARWRGCFAGSDLSASGSSRSLANSGNNYRPKYFPA